MKNCLNYCTPLLIAKELGKKTACLGQGWQGIITELGQRIFKESLSSCEFVSVRNSKDEEALREIGLNTQIITTSDMAFHYYDPEEVPTPRRAEKRVIITLISPRFIPKIVREEYIEVMDKAIRFLNKEYDPIFIKHSPDDVQFYTKYSKELNIPLLTFDWEKISEVENEYRKAECVVTGRFHSLILSVLTDTPIVPLCCKGSKIWNGINNSIPSLQSNLLRVKPPFSFEDFSSIFNVVHTQKKCADRIEVLELFHTAQKNIELLKTLF
jgi:polysaccharide pyruvyl transferase WcaK-like protein